jgi:hypothetical protein
MDMLARMLSKELILDNIADNNSSPDSADKGK